MVRLPQMRDWEVRVLQAPATCALIGLGFVIQVGNTRSTAPPFVFGSNGGRSGASTGSITLASTSTKSPLGGSAVKKAIGFVAFKPNGQSRCRGLRDFFSPVTSVALVKMSMIVSVVSVLSCSSPGKGSGARSNSICSSE